ncbi:DNA methyltransferase [Youngiibacter fragilis]|uniref:DNA methyltransferase n=1 Tax=Youngiibacter fragilis TaxID=1408819 RepID=UPI0004026BBA|nr:DNA methyltransferase [Youngiibacter fragilis]
MLKDLSEVKAKIKTTVATNNNDLYKSHLYWSQKPYNICDILIENFSEKGDIIFDPFMGSGVTLIQAISKEYSRKAVGVEINEVPIFIIDVLLKKYNLRNTKALICKFVDKIAYLEDYYKTVCNSCGEKGIITKSIFDREDFASDPVIKEIHYNCNCSKKILRKDSIEEDYSMMNGLEEYNQINNISNFELLSNTRIAVYKGQKISDIFTRRNFFIIDKVIEIINSFEEEEQELLNYILLSSLHLSKITDTHSNSQWPLWTPKINCVEKNIIPVINKRAKALLLSLKYAQQNLCSNRYRTDDLINMNPGEFKIINKGIQFLSESDIPDNSIDLVITDPPYMGQVLYSEYMQLYKPFLKLDFNLDDEIVISTAPDRKKEEKEYYKLLDEAFTKIGKKVKNNKYMCMYFHDSNLNVWKKIIDILEKAGFRYLSQVHVKKKNTLKNIISPKKSLNGDAVLFFIKEPYVKTEVREVESLEEIELNVIKHAKYIIKTYGPQSTPELYDDGLMEFIIHNGWLSKLSIKYKSLVEIFEKYLIWDATKGKWMI